MSDFAPDPPSARPASRGEAARPAASLQAWADLLRVSRISITEQDLDLRYIAALDQAGLSPGQDLIGRTDADVFTGETLTRLTTVKRGVIESGQPRTERIQIGGDGRVRWFDASVTPRRDEQGRTIGVLSLAVDLTDVLETNDRIRTSDPPRSGIVGPAVDPTIVRDGSEHDQRQAKLLQSQKLEGIGRLAGGVAHDFNNLLTVILGYCELLRMRQRGGTELEEINNAARRASQLTRQLLAFSRRQVLQVETLDLNGLVRGVYRMLRRIIGEDIHLETSLADDALWVVADVGQMEQVLLNLVVNARDAMPDGGTLRIATRVVAHAAPPDGLTRPSVELSVTDSGVGMPEDVRARIFEPFFTTKGDAGTGLGLATVYGIVTQTGGDVACTSAPGAGTTFHVWLPLAEAPKDDGAATSMAGHAAHGHETVLLVEDEALVRDLAARALREYGYTVLEAQDVDGAMQHIAHPGLAIVVSDVVMPGSSGDDLSTEIARRRPDLPVLLMTGYSEALLKRPVDPAYLLRKPFTPTDLIAKIRHLLDRTAS